MMLMLMVHLVEGAISIDRNALNISREWVDRSLLVSSRSRVECLRVVIFHVHLRLTHVLVVVVRMTLDEPGTAQVVALTVVSTR